MQEAATHLVREFEYDKKYPDLPWQEMLGMRIVISHYYWKINDEIVWDTVVKDFPPLKQNVRNWLERLDEEADQ